ncbi:MFS transporter [Desulfofustis limnaeus]|jgi:sugar phosphate permease|uniref:Lysosomal dipeptide transporter MFSD1 n=1 Tax=Desulfofustis limnaeus TaxID=2740163 RepID=A0ABM7WAC4_9BACT|nr:MFS transporter [Desulfofustis limnaeus]BDD87924.1 MFS transporter [Desulfofustis limnaeus]
MMKEETRDYPPAWLGWLMWGLVAVLYLIGFFQRMAPAVMVEELMRDFQLGGAFLGNLSAAYFYSYAAMQIPSGLLVDRIGARRLSTYACAACAVGILIFSYGPNVWTAIIGRVVIGASVAVAFVSCMKLAGHWFPVNRFATVTGVALLFGNIGGVLAGVPLSEAVALFGWRASLAASGFLTLATALVIWLVVRDDPGAYRYRSYAHASVQQNGSLPSGVALKSVVSKRQTWLLFFAGGLSAAPVLVFAGLWGVPYLTQIHGLTRSHAATITTTMLIAWAIGGPVLGAISDRLGRRKLPYLIANLTTTVGWAVFLLVDLPYQMFYPLLALTGFTSGALIIGFAFSREVNHPGASGAVGGVVNMAVLGVAAIMQPALGAILDGRWQGVLAGGARVYPAEAYGAAFLWFPICAAVSVLMVLLTRESYCRMEEA